MRAARRRAFTNRFIHEPCTIILGILFGFVNCFVVRGERHIVWFIIRYVQPAAGGANNNALLDAVATL